MIQRRGERNRKEKEARVSDGQRAMVQVLRRGGSEIGEGQS